MTDNQVLANILKRRSVRKFDGRLIPENELKAIIDAGLAAPSGGNSQSARIIVVRNRAVLDRLRSEVTGAFASMQIREDMYGSIKNSIRLSKTGEYDFMYGAPVLAVAVNKKSYPNALADCGCMLENMMLCASSFDIGSCWINQLHWLDENPAVRECLYALGMDEDETVTGALSLGYSAGPWPESVKRRENRVIYID